MPALLIFAGVSALVVTHVAVYPTLSPFDEGVHYDYVVQGSQGDVVRRGEKLGQEAMREIACRGVDLKGLLLPPCDSDRFVPEAFPFGGFSFAEVHPPLYYGVTGFLARGLAATGIAPDMFTAARLVGILWLGLGLLTIWYLGREVGIRAVPLVIVLVAVAATPTILHAMATVTNDATSIVAGGALVLVTLRWERGTSPLWLVGVVAFLALALKATNALAVGVCALYLLLRSRRADDPSVPGRGKAPAISVLVGSAAVSLFAWIAIRALLATPVEIPPNRPPMGLELLDVLGNLTILITPASYGLPTRVLGAVAFDVIGQFFGFLMVAAALGPVLRGSFTERWSRLAAAGGITMLLGGLLFALASHVLYGTVTVSPRYSLSLLPVLAVALAAAVRWRVVLWGLGAFATGQLALVLWALARAA